MIVAQNAKIEPRSLRPALAALQTGKPGNME
jgi:hypothetical protein